ncbi:hypothetical protein [Candidatus Palauibacter sp.]|uniref:hypothetical protein n=1 Tax=Candidatus Palauibacter sp. TaxID=3101350 RepID=UPI003D0D6FA6
MSEKISASGAQPQGAPTPHEIHVALADARNALREHLLFGTDRHGAKRPRLLRAIRVLEKIDDPWLVGALAGMLAERGKPARHARSENPALPLPLPSSDEPSRCRGDCTQYGSPFGVHICEENW